MASNGFNYHPRSLKLVIRLFDAEFKDSLGYQDFLKLALSKEDQDLRHVAAMRSNKDLLDGQALSPGLECTLAKLFDTTQTFLAKLSKDEPTQNLLRGISIFKMIDV